VAEELTEMERRMTIICWDGKTLAADKRGSDGGCPRTITKIRRTRGGHLMGCSGSANRDAEIMAWYENGADPKGYPDSERDEQKCSVLLVIQPGPIVKYFNGTPYPVVFEDKYVCIGSGRDYAQAALHLGHSAVEAVGVAIALDINCGNGIDALTLADAPVVRRGNGPRQPD
jgi:20S proteasome alpha/beta subunit